jgi:quinol-cytochrome oxidoreductase complex cytochrome b subunit
MARKSKEEKEWYQRGLKFFPDHVLHQMLVILVVICFLTLLAAFIPKGLGITEFEYQKGGLKEEPRPAWYFHWVYVCLKLIPSEVAELGTYVVLGLIWLLMLVPFIDRGTERHPLKRPVGMAVAFIIIALLIYLSFIAPFFWPFGGDAPDFPHFP